VACRLGVLSDNAKVLGNLVSLLKLTNNEVVLTRLLEDADLPLSTLVDAWVISLDEHNEKAEEIIHWLEDNNIATIIADAKNNAVNGELAERLSTKILDCLAQKESFTGAQKPDQLWLLAASAGGPEAVCEFLKCLPKIDNVAFIYVQHIDQNALPSLIAALKNNTELKLELCEAYKVLRGGCVYIAQPDAEFELTESGNIIDRGRPWKGRYRPSINQVVGKFSAHKFNRRGAIFFSGMGDDGIESVRLLKASGSPIWIQSAESCVVDSMPVSIEAAVDVDQVGSPRELAEKFAKLVGNKHTNVEATKCEI
jgi:chemosensory pili system protein ChpB (putative protein-glutamate methylesterase)